MKKPTLKRLLGKQRVAPILDAILATASVPVAVLEENGELSFGAAASGVGRIALEVEGETCGWVQGEGLETERLARLLTYLVQMEQEKIALAQDGVEHYREINLLYRIGEQIFSCQDPAEIARLVILELHKFVRSDDISIILHNRENSSLHLLAASGNESPPRAIWPVEAMIAGEVMASGKVDIINDTSADRRYAGGTDMVGSRMCIPLNTKKSCLGVISISREKPVDFSARDLRLTTALASQTAMAIENAQLYDNLLEQNRELDQLVAKRTAELNASLVKVSAANRLVRQTFGRYLSEEVVDDILSSPEGAALGGENRLVTIMMTDLRGFTSISERLSARDVLSIVNIYLECMTEIVIKHNGTIVEFIGDAILAVFGAPVLRGDDARRAVACAIEMQTAMAEVNARCRELGYPEVEQGIGINTGEAVIGNLGSDKRTKYGLVGANVNLTGRIESYSIGGQILISESTAKACAPILDVAGTLEVSPKGVTKPITLYDVQGLGGAYNVRLPRKSAIELIELKKALPIAYVVLEGKHGMKDAHTGQLIAWSPQECLIQSDTQPEPLSNLKLSLLDDMGNEVASDVYVKVRHLLSSPPGCPSTFKVSFTSVPLEARKLLDTLLQETSPEYGG